MDERQSFAEADWTDTWVDMQRKYWDAWLDLSRQTSATKSETAPEFPASPWSQGIDFWSKLMSPAMPSESRSWMEKTLELNQSYLQFGQTLWKILSLGATAEKDSQQWWDTVTQGFQKMQEQATAGFTPSKDPWAGFAALWGMPIDTWRRVSSACSVMPGDMEKALREMGAPSGPGGLPGLVSGWLSTPTLGYTREWQEELQRWGQLWLEHNHSVKDYTAVLSRVVTRAAELLREKFSEQAKKGESLDSLRAFYNVWVDCGEEAYAEISSSDEFTRAQAKLTNTLMAVKRQEQKMVDEMLSGLNMPTRRELDTSHRRTHQLQRQVWRLAQALEDTGVRQLHEEVSALRRELEELRLAPGPTRAAATAPDRRRQAKSDS